MQVTETFLAYERSTTVMDIISRVLAVFLFSAVIVTAVLGLVLGEGAFNVYFYCTAAAAVIYAAVAFPLGIVAYKRGGNIALCRAYSRVLNRDPRNAVTVIHEGLGVPEKEVVASYKKLSEMGFIENVIIDEEKMLVCLESEAPDREFVCPVCGGKTLLSGDEDVCEFCGAIKEKENN